MVQDETETIASLSVRMSERMREREREMGIRAPEYSLGFDDTAKL